MNRKQRKKKQRRRKHNQDRERSFRGLLSEGAADAMPIRELWSSDEISALHLESAERVRIALPAIGDPESGEPMVAELEGEVAFEALQSMHDFLVGRVTELVRDRGSAEWLFWLRRLRGQFVDVNSLSSTDPYLQSLAESLAAGESRTSESLGQAGHFNFGFDAELLYDLSWLREVSISIYEMQSAMKRCAKGQTISFEPENTPSWVPSRDVDDAIADYDQRRLRESSNPMGTVGSYASADSLLEAPSAFLDHVPQWVFSPAKSKFSVRGPSPAFVGMRDIGVAIPAESEDFLTDESIALVHLLWGAQLYILKTHEETRKFNSTAFQWGYLLATDELLIAIVDAAIELLADLDGPHFSSAWSPSSADEVLSRLKPLVPLAHPPLPGSPLHYSGEMVLIDLVGASKRLFMNFSRPLDGPEANPWGYGFEDIVQKIVDDSLWSPTDEVRALKGKTLYRTDGSSLTDIDAIGLKEGCLLLVSCKAVAEPLDALRGDHAKVRNSSERSAEYGADWSEVVAYMNANTDVLGDLTSGLTAVDGCVVFPTIPYVADRQHREAETLAGFRMLLSAGELERALNGR